MTQLEKILKRREEERLRKEEKARIKEEKRLAKEEEKKKKHKKALRKRQNRRAYKKRRAVELEERKQKGDKFAWHMVVIMKNQKRVKRLGATWWKTDAFQIYSDAIEENKASVLCPVEIHETDTKLQKKGVSSIDMKYEILVVQKTNTPEDNVKKFRNEEGKFIDNVIVDNENYKIIAKHDWLVEEKFNVYGFHPKKARKDAHYILNEMLLKDSCRDNVKRVFTFNNKLVIQYDTDFDFVTCKTDEEAERLYTILEKNVNKPKKNKFILFTGKLNKHLSTWFLNELEKKTGWERESCKRIHGL